ncbi:MAG: SLC45 family MFS transporter, partial [Clostridiales bacterium]|nr:SLC45 family MFS transporter [Clostridiales bacterium]
MKLNYKKTILIGMAFLSICAFWQLYETLVPLILTKTFKIDDIMTGAIMSLDNISALFLLPLFGYLSDRTRSKIGKRTLFIIIGTILAVFSMMLLPLADQKSNFILFIVSLGIVLIAMGSYRSPAVALMTDFTPKPLRSKANAVINLMGALGSIIVLVIISRLVPKIIHPDYTLIFLLVAVLMVISVIILVVTVRERTLPADGEEDKDGMVAGEDVHTGSNRIDGV